MIRHTALEPPGRSPRFWMAAAVASAVLMSVLAVSCSYEKAQRSLALSLRNEEAAVLIWDCEVKVLEINGTAVKQPGYFSFKAPVTKFRLSPGFYDFRVALVTGDVFLDGNPVAFLEFEAKAGRAYRIVPNVGFGYRSRSWNPEIVDGVERTHIAWRCPGGLPSRLRLWRDYKPARPKPLSGGGYIQEVESPLLPELLKQFDHNRDGMLDAEERRAYRETIAKQKWQAF